MRLNLAYAEAMRLVSSRQTGSVVIPDAAQVAGKLYEQGLYDGALRVLNKALTRDAAWYHLQGSILLKKNEAEAAHSCFRTAVRMDPNNALYRQCALNAAVRMRKQKTLRGRMACWRAACQVTAPGRTAASEGACFLLPWRRRLTRKTA